MGMGRNSCYQRSHDFTKLWWEWEVNDVIKDHILLHFHYGNGKIHMLSKITYLYKVMNGMERKRCYKTSHTSTTSLWEW